MLTEKSGDTVTLRRFFSQKLRGSSAKENSSSALVRKPNKLFETPIANRNLPQIRITSERRTSICSKLRFTRTFSSDSIDSLEKLCRKDLRRKRIMMETEERAQNIPIETLLLSPTSSTYPSLRCVGRSRTDPERIESEGTSAGATAESPKLRAQLDVRLKRSSPDLSGDGTGAKPRTLCEVIGLSAYQQKLIIQCWPNIYSTGLNGNFASNIYQNLCNRNAKAKALMQKADGVAVFCQSEVDCSTLHAKLTLELVDTVIRSLDKSPQNLINYLQEIGLCHRNLKREGMSLSTWDDLGDAILDGVRRHDAVRKHKELRRAWLAVIAFLTDFIKQGQSSFRASPSIDIDSSSTSSQQA